MSVRDLAALLAAAAASFPRGPAPQAEQARLERIEALTERAASGAADGWRHELRGRAAEASLRAMLASVAAGEAGDGPPELLRGARIEQALHDPPLRERRGHLLVTRAAPEEDAAPLSDLTALLRAPGACFEVEVDRVQDGDEGRTLTSARLRIVAPAPARQRNERWELEWSGGEEGPRVERLHRILLEHVEALGPGLVDCTAAVLGPVHAADPLLAFGGEWWARRVDALGESSTFGHQGLAVGDVNGDGLEDLYVALGTGLPNRLYLQREDGSVREAAAEAGVAWYDDTKGVLLLDLDGDGDDDLVCALGPALIVHENDGKGHLRPAHMLKPTTEAAFYSLAAADPDLDGDLDLYATRYVKASYGESVPLPFQDARNGPPNHLLRNDGRLRFVDVTRPAGLHVHNDRFSTAAGWIDFDLDGDCDLYVTNDFGLNNLYRNDKGHFVDVAAELGLEDAAAGMGVSFGDVDGDGLPDLYVSNMRSAEGLRAAGDPAFRPGDPPELRARVAGHAMGNQLFLGRGARRWVAAGDALDVRRGGWSWGGQMVDLDLDGRLDLLVPNGFLSGPGKPDLSGYFWREIATRSPAGPRASEPYDDAWIAATRRMAAGQDWAGNQRDACFLQMGTGRFADAGGALGFDRAGDARAMVLVDWDRDGDQDVWVTSRTAPRLRFLRNDLPAGARALTVRLRGVEANRDGIGARVEVVVGGRALVRWVTAGDGYLSQSSRWLTFGLGDARAIERAAVHWPGGRREEIRGLEPGGRYLVVQGSGRGEPIEARAPAPLTPGGVPEPEEEPLGRAILRTPLALPPALLTAAGRVEGRPFLVVLPARERGGEIPEIGELPVTRIEGSGELRPVWEALVEHLVSSTPEEVGGIAVLVDSLGRAQAVYPGTPDLAGLREDALGIAAKPEEPHPRTSRPGLWFFGAPRDLDGLARRLERAGFPREAAFYRDPSSRR